MVTTANETIPWCTVTKCGESGVLSQNCKSSIHFCVRVLHDTIHKTNVRYVDLAIMIPTCIYFAFLTWCLLRQWKVIAKRPLCTVLFSFVYMITVTGVVCKAIAMILTYKADVYKVFALLLRGFILVSEISVVTFGLFFRFYGRRSRYMLLTTVILILLIGVVFTTTEGLLEFEKLHELPCASYNFFTHGGMIFLFCTSVIFCITYLSMFLIYLCQLHKKWNLPSRASFYYYAMILSVINAVQAVGSMLWYEGLKEQHVGQSGICIVTTTTIIYEVAYVPMTYWIFLRNFLRSRSSSTTNIAFQFSPTAQKLLCNNNDHGNYGTHTNWNTNAHEDDDSSYEESGLYSSGGSNFTIA